MKYILFILVFTISCTKKENITNISTNIINQQTNISPEPLVASYDNTINVSLLNRSFFSRWLSDTEQVENGTFHCQGPPEPYRAIYWDSNNNQYYYVFNAIKTNNILYTIDTNLQFEITLNNFNGINREFFDDDKTIPVLYIGNISPLERVYLNPSNEQLYVKTLVPIDDSTRVEYDKEREDYDFIPISLPVYPLVDEYNVIIYTNNNNEKFERKLEWEINKVIGKLENE